MLTAAAALSWLNVGDQADRRCNECNELVPTVRAADVEATLLAMATSQGVCGAACLHCGANNVFPSFTEIEACVCRECELGVTIRRLFSLEVIQKSRRL